MDKFTVTEAKEALMKEHAEFADSTEARKFIYRQLLRALNKGLLKRTDSVDKDQKKVVYSKTSKFFAATLVPTTRASKKNTSKLIKKTTQKVSNYQRLLKKELIAYEIDLTASLEEAKEYNRLSARFPELKEKIQVYQKQTKNQSVQLLGKVHALQKLLGHSITGYQQC